MKLLHTSDWHLGVQINKSDRIDEFRQVIDWLLALVKKEEIDLFLIAGDVFDSVNPPNSARALYYNFISDLSRTCCRHLVVVGGNHDSSSLLDAPGSLLKRTRGLDVHIVGGIKPEDSGEEVIILRDEKDAPEAVICAVPYIPEKYLRLFESGESIEDQDAKALEGYRKHYGDVGARAETERERIQNEFGIEVPMIVTGHLPVSGCEKMWCGDDGMRRVMIGNLNGVGIDVFPESADYIALGHIHRGYPVNDIAHIRYSGSVVPIGFDETEYSKVVCLAKFGGTKADVREIPVPRFRQMKKITGTCLHEICQSIDQMKEEIGEETGYFKAVNTGEPVSGLFHEITSYIEGKNLVCCSVEQKYITITGMTPVTEGESVEDLDEHEAFERLLEARKISEEEKSVLRPMFNEVLNAVWERDENEESEDQEGLKNQRKDG